VPQIQINDRALPLQSPTGAPISVQNQSAFTVYMSGTPDVSQDNYHASIGPNGSFIWPGGQALYVCTNTGATALITYLNNGASVDNSTVTNRNINSVELIRRDTIVKQNNSMFATTPDIPVIDCSAFSSILFTLYGKWTSGGARVAVESRWIYGVFIFTDTNDLTAAEFESVRAAYVPQWYMIDSDQIGIGNFTLQPTFQIPVTGKYLWYRFFANTLITAAVGEYTLITSALGSNQVLTSPKYSSVGSDGYGLLNDGLEVQTQAVIGTDHSYLSSRNGPTNFAISKGATASGLNVNLFYARNGALVAGNRLNINGGVSQAGDVIDIVLPMLPLVMDVITTAANANNSGILTQG
jgi:hypothetical protein